MIKQAAAESDDWMHPRQVLRELERVMPERVMVSTDIGNINSVANSYLRFEEPRSFFAAMSWGNCGYALPTIIGAKKAAPDRPAVAYSGDGAWAMSMVEIMTAVRHNIGVTAVVFHNRQWGAEKKNQVDFYGRRFVAGELDGGEDWSEVARAMGADGVRVNQLEDVGPALTAGHRRPDERRAHHRDRGHVHQRARRPVPQGRPEPPDPLPGQVPGLHLTRSGRSRVGAVSRWRWRRASPPST